MNALNSIKLVVLASVISCGSIAYADTGTVSDSVKSMGTTSKQVVTDSAITAQVKALYVREKLFGDKDISMTGVSVETTNKIVYLSGTVETQAQADNAVKLAQSISDVKKVESKLIVKSVK